MHTHQNSSQQSPPHSQCLSPPTLSNNIVDMHRATLLTPYLDMEWNTQTGELYCSSSTGSIAVYRQRMW